MFDKSIVIAVFVTLAFWMGRQSVMESSNNQIRKPSPLPSKPEQPDKMVGGSYEKVTAEQFDRFFWALGQVESNNNDNAVGDGGKAIGRYQIWKVYWQDAVERLDKKDRGEYNDVRNKDYAEKIMRAYWKRYVPKAYENGDWEVLARVHNGGPRPEGTKERAENTRKYWLKVKKVLDNTK